MKLLSAFLFLISLVAHANGNHCELILVSANTNQSVFRVTIKPEAQTRLEVLKAMGEINEGLDLKRDLMGDTIEAEKAEPARFIKYYLWLYQNTDVPGLKLSALNRVMELASWFFKRHALFDANDFFDGYSLYELLSLTLPGWNDWEVFHELQLLHTRQLLQMDLSSSDHSITTNSLAAYYFLASIGANHDDLVAIRRLRDLQSDPYVIHALDVIDTALEATLEGVHVSFQTFSSVLEDNPLPLDALRELQTGPEALLEFLYLKSGRIMVQSALDLLIFLLKNNNVEGVAVVAVFMGHGAIAQPLKGIVYGLLKHAQAAGSTSKYVSDAVKILEQDSTL